MRANRNRVLIVADQYQFLDSFHCQVAGSLERMTALAAPAPLAVVVDVEAPSFDAVDALNRLADLKVDSRIVLLTGGDPRKLADAKRAASAAGLEVAGTLEHPLKMTALPRLLSQHEANSVPIGPEELRRAIWAPELFLQYQPVLAPFGEKWRIAGVEALVRWQHPQRGLLYPEQFLGLAERASLLGDITDFVMATAVRQAGAWSSCGLDLSVAINLVPSLVGDAGFVDRFMTVLREFGVAPERVKLEIVESAPLQDGDLLRDVFTRLRLHGVSLALDDFGTGYSWLTDLCRLPFDELKLDRTLIRDVPDKHRASTIAAKMIDLAHRLSMRVCAEGVETQDAFEFLETAGCDSVQGILFAPPLSAGEVELFAQLDLAGNRDADPLN